MPILSASAGAWPHADAAVLVRWLRKVRVIDLAEVTCWAWVGGIESTAGYGRFHAAPGLVVAAHRWSWAAATGAPPAVGEVLRHVCDVRCCVNPAHLGVGTPADNVADMVARGRGSNMSLGINRGLARSRSIRAAALDGDTDRLRTLLVEPAQLALFAG